MIPYVHGLGILERVVQKMKYVQTEIDQSKYESFKQAALESRVLGITQTGNLTEALEKAIDDFISFVFAVSRNRKEGHQGEVDCNKE